MGKKYFPFVSDSTTPIHRIRKSKTMPVEEEMMCVIHWFQSWSDLHKNDFMKDLIEKAVPSKVSTLFDAMETLNVKDKPPSIFKCQIKLFDQWFGGWTDHERNVFMQKLELVDVDFVGKFNAEVAATSGQP